MPEKKGKELTEKNTKEYLDTPLWNSGLPIEERLDYLLQQLTLDEKFACLTTGCPEIERLGVPAFYVGGEGAHGVQARHDQSFDRGEPQPTTVFPNPIGMSATWDVDLIKEAGRVVGNEARAIYSKEKRGGLCLWAPTIDMERDPRWGRTEEAYGEDPYLAGKMSSGYIRGLRGEDPFYLRCGATLKHFYANNVEEGRTWISSSIDPRNKHEYYLEPFRRAVVEGGAEGIMTAYNEINGVPCIVNDEVQRIAKDQWGLHHVVCDGGDMKQTVNSHRYFGSHTETIAAGLKAGIDCFTDDINDVMAGAREALERGMISIEDIDRALRNHFGTMIRLGIFDDIAKNPYGDIGEEELNTKENQRIAYEMTRESVVLLKNEEVLPMDGSKEIKGEKVLPIDASKEKVAVIGPWANVWYKDWYSGIPPYQVTPWEGIQKHQPDAVLETGIPQIKLAYGDKYLGILEDGKTIGLVSEEKAETFEITLWDRCQATLRSMSKNLFLTTEDGRDEEGNLRQGIVTASSEEAFGWFVKEAFQVKWQGESFYETLAQGKSLELRSWCGEEYYLDEMQRLRVRVDEEAPMEDASTVAHKPQAGNEEEGSAVLQNSLGKRKGEVGALQGKGISMKQQNIVSFRVVLVKDALKEAARVAAEADKVILLGGANPMINCKEERDRTDIDLSIYQQELNQAVYRANPKLALVLISSIPFAINWEKEHIPAIAMLATGSMELGHGLADVLFGKASPAGRLSMTWYKDLSQLPEMNDYDIIQKERTYQYFPGEVLYPFGHGLTYSELEYRDLKVAVKDRTMLEVSLEIVNQGEGFTDEVVQIYIAKKASKVKRAIRQLKAFVRVKDLQPGESCEVHFEIPVADLQYYDVIAQTMLLEPGEYEIQAGASSKDIRLVQTVSLKGTPRGYRNGSKAVAAEYYDGSVNAILWEGHMGYTSVGTQNPEEAMELRYEEVSTDFQPLELVLDAVMTKGASVKVFIDGKLAGEYTKHQSGQESELVTETGWAAGVGAAVSQHPEGFSYIRIPVKSDGILERACLKLEFSGQVKLCSWRFE